MRFSSPSGFLDASRVPDARMTLYKPRMKYVEYPVVAPVTAYAYTTRITETGDIYAFYLDGNGDIYRGYISHMTLQYVTDPAQHSIDYDWTFFASTGWNAAVDSTEEISLSVGQYHLFVAMDGMLTWYNIDDASEVYNTYVGAQGSICSVAAVEGWLDSAAIVAVLWNDGTQYAELLHVEVGPNGYCDINRWEGAIPNVSHKPRLTAAMNISQSFPDGSDWNASVYVDDHTGLRPLRMHFGSDGVGHSATSEIVPLDAMDDESGLILHHASVMLDKVVLTGAIKRKYGGTHSVLMLGPDKFTFGRDLITIPNEDQDLKLLYHIPHDRVFLAGPNKFYEVPDASSRACILREGTEGFQPSYMLSPHGFDASFTINQPGRLRFEIPWTISYEENPENAGLPQTGDIVNLELRSNVSQPWVQLGRFGVDTVRRSEHDSGRSYMIECSSMSMKRLGDWESDAFFDYISQGEVHGDPADLTKLVRKSGTYDTEDGLVLETLNQDGVLYTTPSASHGTFMAAKFTNLPASEMIVGVGANYNEETLAETAERLGIKLEEVEADQRGRYGVFAAYIPDWDLGNGTRGPRIVVFDYNTIRQGTVEGSDTLVPRAIDYTHPRPWEAIARYDLEDFFHEYPEYAFELPFTVSGTLQLAIRHQDSWVHVYACDNAGEPQWIEIGSCMGFNSQGDPNSDRANYGRGALFLCKNTGMLMSYPFDSETDVIPLYTREERMNKFPPMMEDRPSLLSSTGTVLVDSEQIQYSGIAGYHTTGTNIEGMLAGTGGDLDKHTDELEWVPGKVIAQSVSSWGDFSAYPDVVFAKDPAKLDNYAVQDFVATATEYVTALRVWVKKINFPEDGIEVLAFSGPSCMDTGGKPAFPLGENQLGRGTLPADKISTDGGMVTVFFESHFKVETGKLYRFVVRRARNPQHPNGINYYATKLLPQTSYTGGKLWIFQENNFSHPPFEDWMVDQNGDMPFHLFGRVVAPGNEYAFPVKYETGKGLPSANPPSETHFQNMALTVTEGGGQYGSWRIVRNGRLVDSMNDLFIFYLDRDPGLIYNEETRAKAVPALYGLKRGQNDTLLAAHGDKAKVSRYLDVAGKCTYFEYASADEDLTLAEVAEQIARKAGVVITRIANRYPATQWLPNVRVDVPCPSQNMIARIPVVEQSAWPELHLYFIDKSGVEAIKLDAKIANPGSGPRLTIRANVDGSGLTDLASFPWPDVPPTNLRVSLYNGHLAFWIDGRVIFAYTLPEGFLEHGRWTHFAAYYTGSTPSSYLPLIPEAGTRVESFVMDMGKKGSGLLQSLVGEKRVFYRDNPHGELEIYTERDVFETPYTLTTRLDTTETDTGLATRVLLEGGEVVEVSDAGNIATHGNLFRSVALNEINSLEDAKYFAGVILDDIELNQSPVTFTGAADPRLEAGDVYNVQQVGQVVIDDVSISMMIDEVEAVFDMNVSGRVKPAEE